MSTEARLSVNFTDNASCFDFEPWSQVWSFYVIQMTFLAVMFVVEALIDDVPPEVEVQMGRSEHVRVYGFGAKNSFMVHIANLYSSNPVDQQVLDQTT